MKREEKNMQTKRRIIDSALNEFSEQGYGASSINTICSGKGISKGIIYHYFNSKDDLFLACVEECFCLLTEYLSKKMQVADGNIEKQLEKYFAVRQAFFIEHPVYQRIFCEALRGAPPAAVLKSGYSTGQKSFSALVFLS